MLAIQIRNDWSWLGGTGVDARPSGNATRRSGATPSDSHSAASAGVRTNTQVTALYLHQEDDNTPQYGVPFAGNAYNNGPMTGVDSSDYFGYRDLDKQETQVDSATLIIDHAFNENASVRNLTRYQIVYQDAVTSAVQGTFCLASGINPYTGASCSALNTYALLLP